MSTTWLIETIDKEGKVPTKKNLGKMVVKISARRLGCSMSRFGSAIHHVDHAMYFDVEERGEGGCLQINDANAVKKEMKDPIMT